jgi:hypothetical protein
VFCRVTSVEPAASSAAVALSVSTDTGGVACGVVQDASSKPIPVEPRPIRKERREKRFEYIIVTIFLLLDIDKRYKCSNIF